MNTTNVTELNGTEGVNVVAAVDAVMNETLAQVAAVAAPGLPWANPEEYHTATGKRFRMTKEELEQHGKTPEGRQAAFVARVQAGTLS